ncbi:MAG: type I DNA topoisomerase [Rhodobacteraceae bacterium]|nr:type I DNA topoisomerase [Paracoccaceae bacterium]
MPVVVVESPAKAKTVGKYLGRGYKVVASFGHVRDLPQKDGSVDPDNGFEMTWQVPAESQKRIKEICDALKSDADLILATDPDREGEAISWHIRELVQRRRGLRLNGEPKRVVFNAVTESAVTQAMKEPRGIDMELVDAYLARRALDYLVGYRLSPVLWRKLPGAKSAGRVQSVCVRIISERESEIERFESKEYWNVTALFSTGDGGQFEARLNFLDGRKLGAHDITGQEMAEHAAARIRESEFIVGRVEEKPVSGRPPLPFTTATLQQEASRQLKLSPRMTMQTAQKLYETGLITYMRTDGVDMAAEAVTAVRRQIRKQFGADAVPASPNRHKTRAKNAQEAHECIRPTDPACGADSLGRLDAAQRNLYRLILQRTMACQMKPARFLQTRVDIHSADRGIGLRATGRVMRFAGHTAVYNEGKDEAEAPGDTSQSARLPVLKEGDPVITRKVSPSQHHTLPPPRFTEASLIKKMVELGIGRPSTYSTVVTTIQERGYVERDKMYLRPVPIGRLLTIFLQTYFGQYVEYEFTARMEEELDEISGGRKSRNDVLDRFWSGFSQSVAAASELRIGDVIESLSDTVIPAIRHLEGSRSCPQCGDGRLRLRISRNGNAHVGCSNNPECAFALTFDGTAMHIGPKLLGSDPDSGQDVSSHSGRYGPYVQVADGDGPKRASVPKDMDADGINLETALKLLALPRLIGPHPDDGKPVQAGIGRYGPYVRHDGSYAKLAGSEEAFSVGMNRAVDLLSAAPRRSAATSRSAKQLGEHPQGGAVTLRNGRYGPYVNWKRVNASVNRGQEYDSVTLEDALRLLEAKQKDRNS